MIEEKDLADVCIKHGASKAFVIDADKIPFDENLRTYCEMNHCGNYGNNYACPPHVGKTKELIADILSFLRLSPAGWYNKPFKTKMPYISRRI